MKAHKCTIGFGNQLDSLDFAKLKKLFFHLIFGNTFFNTPDEKSCDVLIFGSFWKISFFNSIENFLSYRVVDSMESFTYSFLNINTFFELLQIFFIDVLMSVRAKFASWAQATNVKSTYFWKVAFGTRPELFRHLSQSTLNFDVFVGQLDFIDNLIDIVGPEISIGCIFGHCYNTSLINKLVS